MELYSPKIQVWGSNQLANHYQTISNYGVSMFWGTPLHKETGLPQLKRRSGTPQHHAQPPAALARSKQCRACLLRFTQSAQSAFQSRNCHSRSKARMARILPERSLHSFKFHLESPKKMNTESEAPIRWSDPS